jgi:hypothetical protein
LSHTLTLTRKPQDEPENEDAYTGTREAPRRPFKVNRAALGCRARGMAFFMFIDESGQDQRESPYEVLAGVVIEDRKVVAARSRPPQRGTRVLRIPLRHTKAGVQG